LLAKLEFYGINSIAGKLNVMSKFRSIEIV
jgi:hypothetical protein